MNNIISGLNKYVERNFSTNTYFRILKSVTENTSFKALKSYKLTLFSIKNRKRIEVFSITISGRVITDSEMKEMEKALEVSFSEKLSEFLISGKILEVL